MLCSLLRCVPHIVDDEFHMTLLEDLSSDWAHAVLAFRRLHEVDSLESFRLSWFPYSFAESAVFLLKILRCFAKKEVKTGRRRCQRPPRKLSLLGFQKTIFIIVTLWRR